MGRQAIEDMIAFLYLSEPNLSPEQEKFRDVYGDFTAR
jgi:hypothetical protein